MSAWNAIRKIGIVIFVVVVVMVFPPPGQTVENVCSSTRVNGAETVCMVRASVVGEVIQSQVPDQATREDRSILKHLKSEKAGQSQVGVLNQIGNP